MDCGCCCVVTWCGFESRGFGCDGREDVPGPSTGLGLSLGGGIIGITGSKRRQPESFTEKRGMAIKTGETPPYFAYLMQDQTARRPKVVGKQ